MNCLNGIVSRDSVREMRCLIGWNKFWNDLWPTQLHTNTKVFHRSYRKAPCFIFPEPATL